MAKFRKRLRPNTDNLEGNIKAARVSRRNPVSRQCQVRVRKRPLLMAPELTVADSQTAEVQLAEMSTGKRAFPDTLLRPNCATSQ
jgi:hypothetical protein